MKDLCDHMDSPPEERLGHLRDVTENFDLDEDDQLAEEYEIYGIRDIEDWDDDEVPA